MLAVEILVTGVVLSLRAEYLYDFTSSKIITTRGG